MTTTQVSCTRPQTSGRPRAWHYIGLAGWTAFTRPAARITADLQREGLLAEAVTPVPKPMYPDGARASGFRIPAEVVAILGGASHEADNEPGLDVDGGVHRARHKGPGAANSSSAAGTPAAQPGGQARQLLAPVSGEDGQLSAGVACQPGQGLPECGRLAIVPPVLVEDNGHLGQLS
jgi:hypothetical protein